MSKEKKIRTGITIYKRKEKHLTDKIKKIGHEIKDEFVHEVFVGRKTLISVIMVVVGGVVVGRTVWEWLQLYLGLWPTLGIGLLLFISGGLIMHHFEG